VRAIPSYKNVHVGRSRLGKCALTLAVLRRVTTELVVTPAPTLIQYSSAISAFPSLGRWECARKVNRIVERGGRHAFHHISKEEWKLFDVDGGDIHHKVCFRLFKRCVDGSLSHAYELLAASST